MSIICKIEPSYSILTTGTAIYFSPSYWDQLPEKLCLTDTGHYILLVFLSTSLFQVKHKSAGHFRWYIVGVFV